MTYEVAEPLRKPESPMCIFTVVGRPAKFLVGAGFKASGVIRHPGLVSGSQKQKYSEGLEYVFYMFSSSSKFF